MNDLPYILAKKAEDKNQTIYLQESVWEYITALTKIKQSDRRVFVLTN